MLKFYKKAKTLNLTEWESMERPLRNMSDSASKDTALGDQWETVLSLSKFDGDLDDWRNESL